MPRTPFLHTGFTGSGRTRVFAVYPDYDELETILIHLVDVSSSDGTYYLHTHVGNGVWGYGPRSQSNPLSVAGVDSYVITLGRGYYSLYTESETGTVAIEVNGEGVVLGADIPGLVV